MINKKLIVFIPGPPQGKGRARAFITKDRQRRPTVAHYTPDKTAKYEEVIASHGMCARVQAKINKFEHPVKLSICAMMPIPVSWPKWKKKLAVKGYIAPTIKPDLDNIEKVVADAFNGVIWKDDTQVVSGEKYQIYSNRIGIIATIEQTGQYSANVKKTDIDPRLLGKDDFPDFPQPALIKLEPGQ